MNTPAEAALSALSAYPAQKFIAGGTNLLDLMKLEIETPTHLIDVNGLGLDKIEVTDAGGLRHRRTGTEHRPGGSRARAS